MYGDMRSTLILALTGSMIINEDHSGYYALQDNNHLSEGNSSECDAPLPLALFCHQVNSRVHRIFSHIANTKSFHIQHQL
jgi:hypothetical protein